MCQLFSHIPSGNDIHSSPWKICPSLRTVNHLFRLGPWLNHGYVSHNQRVIWWPKTSPSFGGPNRLVAHASPTCSQLRWGDYLGPRDTEHLGPGKMLGAPGDWLRKWLNLQRFHWVWAVGPKAAPMISQGWTEFLPCWDVNCKGSITILKDIAWLCLMGAEHNKHKSH